MAFETASSSKSNMLCGLFAAAMGAFVIAGAMGLFGLDLHPKDEAPRWIGVCAGAIFVAGGLAVMLQSLPAAKPAPDGGLSPNSPRWAQLVSLAFGLSIVGGLAAIGLWIAFGPGERHFSGGASFGGIGVSETLGGTPASEIFGRVVFGFGAVCACLVFALFLVGGARWLLRRD